MFDRFSICAAYSALEADWNVDGWLRERPSNQRRRESIDVQLDRMQFHPAQDTCCSFEALIDHGYDTAADIYVHALVRFDMARHVSADDEAHAGICDYVRSNYVPEFVAQHFPGVPS